MKCSQVRAAVMSSVLMALVVLPSGVGAKTTKDAVVPLTEPIPWSSQWTATKGHDGGRALVWYGERPSLQVTQPDGSVSTLVGKDDTEQAPSGLAVAADSQGVWVAYRNKEPARDVYLARVGKDGIAPVGVSADTMALARLSMHATGDGVDAFWYGERNTDGVLYNIFHRRLDSKGKPVSEAPELVLPGIYPVTLQDAEGHLGVMSWVKDDKGSRIVARSRRAGTMAFSETVLVRETTPEMTIPFEAFASGSRWFVQWVAQHGETKDDYLIEGAWSDDQGATWTPYELASLRGMGIETQSIAANGREIVMAFSVADRAATRPEYRDVRIVRSEDNGQTWLPAEKVRDEKAEYAIARSPKVAFLDDKRVMLAWEDWREVRGRVRYSVSDDGGRSWKVRDARLPIRPKANVIMNMFANAIVPDGKGGAEVVVEELTDQFMKKQLVGVRLDSKALLKPVVVPAVKQGNLRKQVEAYWTALKAQDYKKAYDQLDPFYRGRVEFAEYLSAMGRVKYHDFKVLDIRLEGNIAHVSLNITAEVAPFFSQGRMIEVPKHERKVELKWVSLDGEWYHEYYSEARGMRFTRY